MENLSLDLSITKPSADYELIDSGNGQKLERFGAVTVSRPDPQALWLPRLSNSEWQKAAAVFLPAKGKGGKWRIDATVPAKWQISLAGLKFWIQPSAFKHVGIFPEQSSNWQWIRETISTRAGKNLADKNPEKKISVLNLFGYTGGATLAAAQAGAEVVHVDASKTAIRGARANADISGLSEKPIRWILDDARAFLEREVKRGNFYHGIIMDPPAFGHGPTGKLWKIEEDFTALLSLCEKVLAPDALFMLINGYASGYSALAYENNLKQLIGNRSGIIEKGELAIEEASQGTGGESKTGRLLPAGIFARWRAA
jgi:23S rRNA (cytosine1962-C5)-methyltransferase